MFRWGGGAIDAIELICSFIVNSSGTQQAQNLTDIKLIVYLKV
jgi:hypothetical protein